MMIAVKNRMMLDFDEDENTKEFNNFKGNKEKE
jgi:hypothetical protein